MRCPHCGYTGPRQPRICPRCGKRVSPDTPALHLYRDRRRRSIRLLGRGGLRLPLIVIAGTALALAVALLAAKLLPGAPAPQGGPEPTQAVEPAVEATATPEPERTPGPPWTPEGLTLPETVQPSLSITQRGDLIALYWWMIESGTASAHLDALSLEKDVISEVANQFSNYFESCSYTSEPRITVSFKSGVKVLQALQRGEADRLEGDDLQVAERAKAVLSGLIRQDMTDLEKELAIHDYIVDHCEVLTAVKGEDADNARGFFLHGLCQCAGYVDAFRLLGRMAGLEVEMIGGPTTRDAAGEKGHAWNLIRLDGLWYVVDACWDDPAGSAAAVEHTYFNLPGAMFGDSRTWDQSCCPEGEYAEVLDSFYYYDDPVYRAYTEEEALEAAIRQIDAGGRATIFFAGADASQSVGTALAGHYNIRGSVTRLGEDLNLVLVRYSLQ